MGEQEYGFSYANAGKEEVRIINQNIAVTPKSVGTIDFDVRRARSPCAGWRCAPFVLAFPRLCKNQCGAPRRLQ